MLVVFDGCRRKSIDAHFWLLNIDFIAVGCDYNFVELHLVADKFEVLLCTLIESYGFFYVLKTNIGNTDFVGSAWNCNGIKTIFVSDSTCF